MVGSFNASIATFYGVILDHQNILLLRSINSNIYKRIIHYLTFYYNYTRKLSLVYYLSPYNDDKDTILI